MSERFWFLSVRPFDEEHVVEWVERLSGSSHGSPEVELIDNRQWFARAMDADGVRAAVVALKEGIAGSGISEDIRWSVAGLVSDMETWLERDYDSRPD